MRILIANTRHYAYGGDSAYAFALADALRNAGHEVAFFAMAGEKNVPDPNEDLFVSYIDFRELNRKKSLSTGVRVLGRSIFSVEAATKFNKLVERFQPDVLHLQNIHAHLTPSIIFAARKQGLPVVWTLHDYKLMCPNSHFLIDASGAVCESCRPGRYHWAVAKKCKKGSVMASAMASLEAYAHWIGGVPRKVNTYLAPSRFLANKLLEHGWPADRVQHVPNFIDAGPAVSRQSDGDYFLFVGKLEALKGIDTLLSAAAQVPHIPLRLVGGCDDPAIQARLDSLPPNVEHLGVQPRERVRELLAGARALVLPSVCYENQPMTILEAFAAGLPVIGSRIGGIPELVVDGERGLLFEAGDARGLAEAMWRLHDDVGAARAMGRGGRYYVTRHHSVERHVATVSEIYRNAIGAGEAERALAH